MNKTCVGLKVVPGLVILLTLWSPPSEGTQFAYMTSQEMFVVINLQSQSAVQQIYLPETRAVGVHPDGTTVYVGRYDPWASPTHSVLAIDAPTGTVVHSYSLPNAVRRLHVHPDGSRVYAGWTGANGNPARVVVLDSETLSERKVIQIGDPASGTNGIGGFGMHPDGRHLYVAHNVLLEDTVFVIDTATDEVVDSLPTGDGPQGIAFSPDGQTAYVASFGEDAVYMSDLASKTITAVVPVVRHPIALAVDPASRKIYATGYTAGRVSVIDPDTNTVLSEFDIGTSAIGIQANGEDGLIYIVGDRDLVAVDPADDSIVNEIRFDPLGQAWGLGEFLGPEVNYLSCSSFDPPLGSSVVRVSELNRSLPVRIELVTGEGTAQVELTYNPVAEVLFTSRNDFSLEPDDDDLLPLGWASDGNRFLFDGERWTFNLDLRDVSGPGTYSVCARSGNNKEYWIDLGCCSSFVIE